jgi:hypothetical protein
MSVGIFNIHIDRKHTSLNNKEVNLELIQTINKYSPPTLKVFSTLLKQHTNL